jgi:hypothetical protein
MGLINRISGGLKTAEVPLHVTGRRSWKTRFNYNKSFMEIPWNKLKNGNENELNVFNIVYRFILSRASYSTKGYKFYVMIQYCSTLVSSWLINNPIRPVFVYLYVSFFSFFFVGFFLGTNRWLWCVLSSTQEDVKWSSTPCAICCLVYIYDDFSF